MIPTALALVLLVAPPLARPVDEHTVLVDRAQALALFADPSPLEGQVWGVPVFAETRGGFFAVRDLVGIRVDGIEVGSTVHGLGLRNGDVVRRVGGRPIAGLAHLPALARHAEAELRAGRDIVVGLVRGGRPLDLTLRTTPRAG